MSKTLISIVSPVYNEEAILAEVVKAIVAAVAPLADEYDFEVILVDDGSADGSWETIRSLKESMPGVRGLRFSRNFGQLSALLAGLTAARGAAVVTMDSDGQHPPEMLPDLIARWRDGVTVVQGVRSEVQHDRRIERWAARWFYKTFSWMVGFQVPRGSVDFRLLDRRVVDLLLAHPRLALFQRGFVPWIGMRTEHMNFTTKARVGGASKYSIFARGGVAREGILRFTVTPLRLASMLGLGIGLLSIVAPLCLILIGTLTPHEIPGWAWVACLLGFLAAIQLLVIGILGEYLGVAVEAQLQRPSYIIAEEAEASPAEPGAKDDS